MALSQTISGSLLRRLAEARFRLACRHAKPGDRALAELFGEDAETAVLIGRAYVGAARAETGRIAHLAERLNGCGTPARALAELRSTARRDRAQGRSFIFDGWAMAEAEAQACALVSGWARAASGAGGR